MEQLLNELLTALKAIDDSLGIQDGSVINEVDKKTWKEKARRVVANFNLHAPSAEIFSALGLSLSGDNPRQAIRESIEKELKKIKLKKNQIPHRRPPKPMIR